MKLRNAVRSLHGSIGLLMGLFFLIVSLTGSSIVFHNELDQAINQSLFTVAVQPTSISFDDIIAPVQKAHPEMPVQSVRLPKQSGKSYVVTMTDKQGHQLETFVNPYTGAILGERVWEYSLIGFLYTLHHELFLGKIGMIILIVVGIAMLFMSITGVILWTGWRKLKAGFTIRWNAPKSLLIFDLHQVSGIVTQILLSTLVVTGVIIVLLHLFPVGGETAVAIKSIPDQPPLPFTQLLQKADTAMPGGQVVSIFFEAQQPRKFTINKHFSEQKTGRFNLSTVELDRYTGEILIANKVIQPDVFFSVLILITNLHFGTIAGLPSRILYFFVGVVPLLLFLTGIKIFTARRWYIRV